MSAKEQYIKYCEANYVALFFRPYWLEASMHEWQVLYAQHEGYEAFWIYHFQRKMGFSFIRNPHLTPYTGFILCDDKTPQSKQETLFNLLIQQLPSFDVLELDLSLLVPRFDQFTRFDVTYRRTNILALEKMDMVYANLKPALKRQILKAEKALHIFELDDIELFYQLHIKTFQKNNQKPSIEFEVMHAYWQMCKKNNCGKLLFIHDEMQQTHAALWLVYDDTTSYYLAGGTDSTYYGSGAMSKLMWHAIQLSNTLNKKIFDFEGSNIQSIDRFFKNFNPKEILYLHLEKINSIIYKLLKPNKNPE